MNPKMKKNYWIWTMKIRILERNRNRVRLKGSLTLKEKPFRIKSGTLQPPLELSALVFFFQ